MSKREVVGLQHALNRFTRTYLHDVPDVMVDGKRGHATGKRVRLVKYYLGYVKSRRNGKVGQEFLWRLHHPKQTKVYPGGYHQTATAVRRGKKRRKTQRRLSRINKYASYLKPGVTRFDGIPVAKTAVPILRYQREVLGWLGRLISGVRTKAYSRHLCFAMCGAPYCPGRCAGDRTNHVGIGPDNFALDVSDYGKFGANCPHVPANPKLHNYLPYDPVHYSPSGR